MLQEAIRLAVEWHKGQNRKFSNQGKHIPYVAHPFSVMKIVWAWGAGKEDVMSASICHDLIEDTEVTYEFLKVVVGEDAADIVKELTFDGVNKEEYMKSFYTSSIDALIIKVADRLDNVKDFMLTLPHYAQKYFDKAEDLFGALMSRLDEIRDEYGEQTSKNIVDSYLSVKISLSILETNKEENND